MTRDLIDEAEVFFTRFAQRHDLHIQKKAPVGMFSWTVPRQPGLAFDLTLGLQNDDEINIGFEGFWSYYIPFHEVLVRVNEILDGIVSGRVRLVVYASGRMLEEERDGGWRVIYPSAFVSPSARPLLIIKNGAG